MIENPTVHFLDVRDQVTQLVGSYDMRNPTKSAPHSHETETKPPEGGNRLMEPSSYKSWGARI